MKKRNNHSLVTVNRLEIYRSIIFLYIRNFFVFEALAKSETGRENEKRETSDLRTDKRKKKK